MEVSDGRAGYRVRPGYKMTEVGVVPEDWEISTLGELTLTSSGTTPPRARAERYFTYDGIPWVKTLDLNNGTITSTEEAVTTAAIAETALVIYPESSVLIAMYGGFNQIGRTGILSVRAAVNQALTAIRPISARLFAPYLLRVLNFRVNYWRSVASSSRKDPNITSRDIREFFIGLPPLAEQKAIGEAIGDADALIEVLEQLLAKKRQIKQGAMQELLTGERRLPGFCDDWKAIRLGECFEVFAGGDLNLSVFCPFHDDAHPFPIYSNAVTNEGLYGFSSIYSENADSITVTARGTIGVANFRDHPYTAIGRVLVLTRKFSLDPRFFAYLINSRVNFVMESTGVPQLTAPQLAAVEVRVPLAAEQTAIATLLSDLDTEIAALEAKLAKARAVKQGMMQELLTGRIRLV